MLLILRCAAKFSNWRLVGIKSFKTLLAKPLRMGGNINPQ
jgi:hypothetical protein